MFTSNSIYSFKIPTTAEEEGKYVNFVFCFGILEQLEKVLLVLFIMFVITMIVWGYLSIAIKQGASVVKYLSSW